MKPEDLESCQSFVAKKRCADVIVKYMRTNYVSEEKIMALNITPSAREILSQMHDEELFGLIEDYEPKLFALLFKAQLIGNPVLAHIKQYEEDQAEMSSSSG